MHTQMNLLTKRNSWKELGRHRESRNGDQKRHTDHPHKRSDPFSKEKNEKRQIFARDD